MTGKEPRLPRRVAIGGVILLAFIWTVGLFLIQPVDWYWTGVGALSGIFFTIYSWAYLDNS